MICIHEQQFRAKLRQQLRTGWFIINGFKYRLSNPEHRELVIDLLMTRYQTQ